MHRIGGFERIFGVKKRNADYILPPFLLLAGRNETFPRVGIPPQGGTSEKRKRGGFFFSRVTRGAEERCHTTYAVGVVC